jgi:hypothetical protein
VGSDVQAGPSLFAGGFGRRRIEAFDEELDHELEEEERREREAQRRKSARTRKAREARDALLSAERELRQVFGQALVPAHQDELKLQAIRDHLVKDLGLTDPESQRVAIRRLRLENPARRKPALDTIFDRVARR